MPYGVGGGGLVEDIQEEILGRKKGTGTQAPRQPSRLSGVARLNDDSDRDAGTRVVVECKVGVNPQALLADLYAHTKAEITFGINNNCLIGQVPQVLGLKRLLEVFIEHRFDVVRRRTTSRRDKRAERLHLVEGLLKALIDIDKVIKIIRNADDDTIARDALMKQFRLTEIQANYILNTRLRSLTKYNRLDLEGENDRLTAEIAELQTILDDETVLRKVISDELADIAKKYTTDRKTTLIDGDLKEVLAASIPTAPREVTDDPCQVILSATGLIARTAAESEEATEARRKNGRTKHDAIRAIAHTTARGQVLLITSLGRAIKTDVLSLPVLPTRAGTVSLSGMMPAREIIDLAPGETVIALAPLGDKATGIGLALGTRQGIVKITKPEWPVRSDDFEVISLKDGDEVIGATWLTTGTEKLTFIASDASLLHIKDDVRPQGLSGGGMAGISLAPDAEVVFFGAVRTDDPTHGDPVVITSTGGGIKVTPFDVYPAKGRATGGVRAMRFLKTRNNEAALTLAWVGPRPAAVTTTGDPVDLPDLDNRRDGSGETMTGPAIIGHLVERD
jgi:DNA gyrase subunit A